MAIDLTAAQAGLERVLMGDGGDTCRITHDPQATDDDTLDPDSLDLIEPPGDAVVLYEGACVFSSRVSEGRTAEEGGVDTYRLRYKAKLPVSAPVIPTGARFEVTACPNDPAAVGLVLVVLDAPVKSLALARRLVLQEIRPVPSL